MPECWIQISEEDAKRMDIKDGERVVVKSRHGEVELPANIGNIEVGQIFSK